MRLLTHNLLICNVAKCVATVAEDNNGIPDSMKRMNWPLQIVLNEGGLEEREDNFDKEFVLSMLKKIDWTAFHQGAADIGYTVPEEQPTDLNDEVLKQIHHALLELEVMSGKLVCRHCGREYLIEQGIPNMLLREDEV
ncbi:hypothetical protein WA588_004601 [Blastocystis sp. NMH]